MPGKQYVYVGVSGAAPDRWAWDADVGTGSLKNGRFGLPASADGPVVVAAWAVDETTTKLPCEAVLAVVEVVSPSTVTMDRAIKPVMYGEAGIPVYWRWSCMTRRGLWPVP
jgi:hypothetical protein